MLARNGKCEVGAVSDLHRSLIHSRERRGRIVIEGKVHCRLSTAESGVLRFLGAERERVASSGGHSEILVNSKTIRMP